MVQFLPERCIKLFKYILRNITVQNTDTENIQCAGAIYLLYSTIYIPHRRCPYFDVGVWLEWSNDPES
jgi:hypothetical protein